MKISGAFLAAAKPIVNANTTSMIHNTTQTSSGMIGWCFTAMTC